jgi:DNA-binding beta-propeller fold protein YncE
MNLGPRRFAAKSSLLARLAGFSLLAAFTAAHAAPRTPERLPTGALLDPAGTHIALGAMPLRLVPSPDSARVVVLLCGRGTQGVQVVDVPSGQVTQTLAQPAAFFGLAFSPDGRVLYASGGYRDVVYRYDWQGGAATLRDSLRLAPADSAALGVRYPAGLAVSRDGRFLFVAENLADSLAVVDVGSGKVVQRFATGRYPYGVLSGPEGSVYVSAWGGSAIATFAPSAAGLSPAPPIACGEHPSALVLSADGRWLYAARASYDRIAIIDTQSHRMVGEIRDTLAGAPSEGATPDGLGLSADGRRLYVAEADHDAVAVFAIDSPATTPATRLLGRIPVEWYPTGVIERGGRVLVINGKGAGSAPNPGHGQPGDHRVHPTSQTAMGQLSGSLIVLHAPDAQSLRALSPRVTRSQGWNVARRGAKYPPFRHVVYIIKENRTYDQMLGDMPQGDGDTSLVYFPRAVTPNHHALADRFGLFDRFHVNAEVSGQGHNWSTAAYCSDYVEKTIPSLYSDRGRSYDFEGVNRDQPTDDDAAEPGQGYLWDAAIRAHVSLRNHGEFTHQDSAGRWVADKRSLAPFTDPAAPGWDLKVPDQARADAWLTAFRKQVRAGRMPQLTIMRLPNDHTAGSDPGMPTPRAMVADNDLALGRVIDALSHSRFWASTVVFVLEDDAQDGPDHVDSHRSPLFIASAYNRPGVIHEFANTTDVLAAIGRILHLKPLSHYDHFARSLAGVFAATPDMRPYSVITPGVSLQERNLPEPARTGALEPLDLRREDPRDEDRFNRQLWAMLKGKQRPYPERSGKP